MFTTAPPPAVSTIFGTHERESRNALRHVEAQRVLEEALARVERRRAAPCRPRCSRARRGGRTPRRAAATSALERRPSASRRRAPRARAGRASRTSTAVASRSARVRAAHTTSAPASANASAMPRPMPLARARHDRDAIRELEAVEDHRAAPPARRRLAADERQVEVGLDAGLGAAHVRDRADAVDRRRDDARVAHEARRDRLRVRAVERDLHGRIARHLDLEALALGPEASRPARGAPRP